MYILWEIYQSHLGYFDEEWNYFSILGQSPGSEGRTATSLLWIRKHSSLTPGFPRWSKPGRTCGHWRWESDPPVGGDSADWIFSDQVCDGQRRGEIWVSSEHGAQDEQEGGAGGGCSQGWFPIPPLSQDSNISSRSEYSVAPTSTWGSSAPYTWSASSVPPSSAPSSWCGNTTGSWSLGPAWSRSRTLHPPPVPLWALVEWTDTKLGTTPVILTISAPPPSLFMSSARTANTFQSLARLPARTISPSYCWY